MRKRSLLYKFASGMTLVAAVVVAPASWMWAHQANTPKELLKK